MFGSKASGKIEDSIKLATHQPVASKVQDFSLVYSG